jgi:hypothetical protein
MATVHLNTSVGSDRKLIVQLPEDIPPGDVELIVRSTQPVAQNGQSARDAAKAKLLQAGALVVNFEVPEGAVRLSVEERMRLGKLPLDAPDSLDLIHEDRGE